MAGRWTFGIYVNYKGMILTLYEKAHEAHAVKGLGATGFRIAMARFVSLKHLIDVAQKGTYIKAVGQ